MPLTQVWTMSSVYLIYFTIGLASNTFHEGYSQFITLGGIFTIIGYAASSLLMDRIGRRLTFIFGISSGLAGNLIMNSNNTLIAILREALTGLSFGSTLIMGLIIIGEYTSPKYRSVFLNMTTTSIFLGRLGRQILNHFQYTNMNISLILQVMSFGITLTWPKSPYWLALHGHYQECEEAFYIIRGEEDSEEKQELLNRRNTSTSKNTFLQNVIKLFKVMSIELRQPITVIVFGVILVESSGRHHLPNLAEEIFSLIINEHPAQKLYLSIIVALSSATSLVLISCFKQTRVLFATGLASIISLIFGTVSVFLITNKIIFSSSWIGLILILAYVVFANMGPTSIPLVLIGEIFPLEHKAVGSLMAGLLTSAISWMAIRIGTCLLASLGVNGTLAIFGLLMTISLLFIFFMVPETKGKTLLEIEEYFKDGWFEDDDEVLLAKT